MDNIEVTAVFERQSKTETIRDTLTKAIFKLQQMAETGDAIAIGIYDPAANVLWEPSVMPFSPSEQIRRMRQALKLPEDHQFDDIEVFDAYKDED